MPTTLRSSPTTTRAVNEKRRPPFTTLATRLISTTRSWRSYWAGLMLRGRAMKFLRVASRLEPEPGLAGALGERAHAAVVAVAAAVEDDGLGAGVLGALRDQLARAFGLIHARQVLELLLGPVDRGERVAADVVDDLGLNATVRAEHREPRTVAGALHLGAHATAATQTGLVLGLAAHARLPTFRATYSSA